MNAAGDLGDATRLVDEVVCDDWIFEELYVTGTHATATCMFYLNMGAWAHELHCVRDCGLHITCTCSLQARTCTTGAMRAHSCG